MKKFIFFLLPVFLLASPILNPIEAQSRQELQEQINDLEDSLAKQSIVNNTLEQNLENLATNFAELKAQSEGQFKIAKTVEDAKKQWQYYGAILIWLFTGILRKVIPKWINSFVISIFVGVVITILSLAFSDGVFTIANAVEFLVFISGGGNILHRLKGAEQLAEDISKIQVKTTTA